MLGHTTCLALKRFAFAVSVTFCLSGCGFIWPILPNITTYKTTVETPKKGSFEGIKTLAIVHPAILGEQEDPNWMGLPVTEHLTKNTNFRVITPNQVLSTVQKKGSVPAVSKTTSMTTTERGDYIKQIGRDVSADALVFVNEKFGADFGILFGPRFRRTLTMKVIAIQSDTVIWNQEIYGHVTNSLNVDNPQIRETVINMMIDNFNQTAK